MKHLLFSLILACVLAACNEKPAPTADDLFTAVSAAGVPLESVMLEDVTCTFTLTYGGEANRPAPPRLRDDTLTIATTMCNYLTGYNVNIVLSDGVSEPIDKRLIISLCGQWMSPDVFWDSLEIVP